MTPVPSTGNARRALTGSWVGPRVLLGAPVLWDITGARCCPSGAAGSTSPARRVSEVASREGFRWWLRRDPSAGEARVVPLASTVGFGLGAGSRGVRSTPGHSFAESSRPEGGSLIGAATKTLVRVRVQLWRFWRGCGCVRASVVSWPCLVVWD